MKTIVLDGKEYILIPKDDEGVGTSVPESPESPLADFLGEVDVHIDDGLSTDEERQGAVQVIDQTSVVPLIPSVRKAQGREYEYRTRFMNHEITPGDIYAPPKYQFGMVRDYRDVPMIEADKNRPKEQQLFYGEGVSIEGVGY